MIRVTDEEYISDIKEILRLQSKLLAKYKKLIGYDQIDDSQDVVLGMINEIEDHRSVANSLLLDEEDNLSSDLYFSEE